MVDQDPGHASRLPAECLTPCMVSGQKPEVCPTSGGLDPGHASHLPAEYLTCTVLSQKPEVFPTSGGSGPRMVVIYLQDIYPAWY